MLIFMYKETLILFQSLFVTVAAIDRFNFYIIEFILAATIQDKYLEK